MCFITIISYLPLAYFSAFCYNDLKLFLNKSQFLPITTIKVIPRFFPNFHIRLNIYNPFFIPTPCRFLKPGWCSRYI